MGTYLDAIIERHRLRASTDSRSWQERLELATPKTATFGQALKAGPNVSVIAEIKRKSPSKGWLAPDLNAAAMATLYVQNGASAISVLTDEEGFGGTLKDLREVRAITAAPVLRKDFTVSHNDILDAFDAGADAVLLIVAALSDEELTSFFALANHLGLDSLVEVHSAEESLRAQAAGAEIIGINQRNLKTFEVDVEHAARLASSLPSHVVKVCESGLRLPSDVEAAGQAGFDAVLVGEHFVTSEDPGTLVRHFTSVARV